MTSLVMSRTCPTDQYYRRYSASFTEAPGPESNVCPKETTALFESPESPVIRDLVSSMWLPAWSPGVNVIKPLFIFPGRSARQRASHPEWVGCALPRRTAAPTCRAIAILGRVVMALSHVYFAATLRFHNRRTSRRADFTKQHGVCHHSLAEKKFRRQDTATLVSVFAVDKPAGSGPVSTSLKLLFGKHIKAPDTISQMSNVDRVAALSDKKVNLNRRFAKIVDSLRKTSSRWISPSACPRNLGKFDLDLQPWNK